jgi:hypothetical protein
MARQPSSTGRKRAQARRGCLRKRAILHAAVRALHSARCDRRLAPDQVTSLIAALWISPGTSLLDTAK